MLFDLFHTLAVVPPPSMLGEPTIPQLLGVPAEEWLRLYYEDDLPGRYVNAHVDDTEAMRAVTHAIDPSVPEARILAAAESRRHLFSGALMEIEGGVLLALRRLRAAGIRTAVVSDAGTEDVCSWPRSPLSGLIDAAVFSCQVGVRKPDRRIYERALADLGVPANQAVFVGDGGHQEHQGARAVGLTTVLVTRLAARWWPDLVAARQAGADWTFEDVAAFVRALDL